MAYVFQILMVVNIGQIDPEGGVMVVPKEGFVMKGFDQADGGKVFVNVCYSEWISPPHQHEESGIRVPMSIGSKISDLDKKGNPCCVIDIVVSEDTVRRSVTEPDFKVQFAELALRGIEMKWNLKLKQLREVRMPYKGVIRPQRIRVDKSLLIEEVPSATADDHTEDGKTRIPKFTFDFVSTTSGDRRSAFDLPQYRSTETVLRRALEADMNGTPTRGDNSIDYLKFSLVEIGIPNVINVDSVRLQVSNQRLAVTTTGLLRRSFNVCPTFISFVTICQIWFPVELNAESAKPQFDENTNELIISLSVM